MIAQVLLIAAYVLSVLRLPFAVLPYLAKTTAILLIRWQYRVSQNDHRIEVVRILGDYFNLGLTSALLLAVGLAPWIINVCATAEFIRLMLEKGQMVFSAMWGCLPHRAIAGHIIQRVNGVSAGWLRARLIRYSHYYALDDEERMAFVLRALRVRARLDASLTDKLRYVSRLRIVPDSVGLRGGAVRNVARGEIYIHRGWTNDPFLLMGLILRRSPWVFDPRYLPRPFYYRTQSNRLMTLCVFEHVHYCLPFALYQFGHEIKAARYDLAFRLLRGVGIQAEAPVGRDGTYQFDPFLRWLRGVFLSIPLRPTAPTTSLPLLGDAAVIDEVRRRLANGELLSAMAIAEEYTYPLRYVDEVLWARIAPESAFGVELTNPSSEQVSALCQI